MRKHTSKIILSSLVITILFGFQNCGGRKFDSYEAQSLSVCSNKQNKRNSLIQDKVYVSKSWYKGFRKATVLGNQLVITFDVNCISQSKDFQSFLGHKIDLSGIPENMKHFALAFDFPGAIDENSVRDAAENNLCILSVAEQKQVKKVQFHAAASTVSDPLVPDQNYLDFVKFDQSYTMRSTISKKVTVAIIDTGINYNHPDLSSQMWQNGQGRHGYDFISNNDSPLDDDGHGTHVAGIVGAKNNNAIGTASIAGDHVELMSIKVLGTEGTGSVDKVYQGIVYAITNKADIINLSMEAPGESPIIEQGIKEAIEAGIVVVLAAGNGNMLLTPENLVAPAYTGPFYGGAITVASLDSANGNRSQFSNYGEQFVEIIAPGAFDTSRDIGILSTYESGYKDIMGTSQAAPMVSASLALLIAYLKSNNVNYTPSSLENWIKDKGSRNVTSLRQFVHGGDVLDLQKLSDATIKQFPPGNSNTLKLPSGISTRSACN